MEQILEKLFESGAKVRIIRLFARNSEHSFLFSEIAKRTKTKPPTAKSEINKLVGIGLIQKKTVSLKGRKSVIYNTNNQFPVLQELKALIAQGSVPSRRKIYEQIKRLGRIKLAVLSGVFINKDVSRTDLLIVGDNINKTRLDQFLSSMESEIGKSLQYTVMDSKEFEYRRTMYDRFLRDVLEYPHEKIINKLGI